jgi:hypothetical protein
MFHCGAVAETIMGKSGIVSSIVTEGRTKTNKDTDNSLVTV